MAAFVVACAAVYYVLSNDDDMEWLRTRIETTLNERSNGELTFQLKGAKIVVEKAEGAHLLISGLSVADREGRFVANSGNIKILPSWLSLATDHVSIRKVSIDGADIQVVTSAESIFPDVDTQPEVLLVDIFSQNKPTAPTSVETGLEADVFQNILGFEDDATDLSAELPENIENYKSENGVLGEVGQSSSIDSSDNQSDSPADIETDGDNPEILRLISSGLNEFGGVFDRIHQLGLGELDLQNVAIEMFDEEKNLLRKLGITSAVYSEISDYSAARPQQHFAIKTKQSGGNGIDLNVTHVSQNVGSSRAFVIGISNIIASNFIKKLADPIFPMKLNVPFGIDGEIVLDDRQSISRLDVKISVGEGSIRTAPNSIFNVDSGALNLTLNRRSHQMLVKPSPFIFGKNRFVVQGGISLADELLQPYNFRLFANDVHLDSSDANAAPLVVDKMIANGAFQLGRKLISISEFSVQVGEVRGDAAVSFGFDGKTPSMSLVAEIDKAPVAVLKQVWPVFIAPSARGWTLKNLHDGEIRNARIATSIPNGVLGNLRKGATLQDHEMVADFNIVNSSFKAFGEFPDIENADLRGKVRGISFEANLDRGKAVSKFGGAVQLNKAQFKIDDFRFPGPKADISLTAKGKADDVGEIANRKPVRALTFAKIEPRGLSGDVLAKVALSLPLRPKLGANDVDWKAGLGLTKFSSPKPIDGRKIDNATAEISITPQSMTIDGKGKIDGIEADIDMQVPFKGNAKSRTLAVKLVLDDKDLKKIGIDFGEFLTGPMSVEIDQDSSSDKRGDLYKIDLSRAEINLDFIGWKKSKGVAASARMRLITTSKGTQVRDFSLVGDGFGAQGTAEISNSGDIARLNLSKLALKKGDSIAVNAVLRAERTYDIKIDGRSFDARSLIHVLTDRPNSAADANFRYKIKATIGEVTGYIAEKIRGFSMDVSLRGPTVLKLMVSGITKNAKAPFDIRYGAVSGKGDVLTANGPDGGAIARFANIYYRAFGGPFTITGQRPPGVKALTGKFRMRRFALVDEPALSGLGGGASTNGKPSVKFNVLKINFTEQDQKLRVEKGLLSGDNIGGTYEGVLNRKTKEIDFTGTYVPIYVLNNFFTKIPIVGQVLGNGKREGLIGVTFKVKGTIGKPKVTVNPLSALAPGFLRQLFRFRKTDQQSTN
ncbi:MAG: AsmA-like C-terminal domain-containing protein [Hyphomicrobiales bacterium]